MVGGMVGGNRQQPTEAITNVNTGGGMVYKCEHWRRHGLQENTPQHIRDEEIIYLWFMLVVIYICKYLTAIIFTFVIGWGAVGVYICKRLGCLAS